VRRATQLRPTEAGPILARRLGYRQDEPAKSVLRVARFRVARWHAGSRAQGGTCSAVDRRDFAAL